MLKMPGAHMFSGDHAWTVLKATTINGEPVIQIACPCGVVKYISARVVKE